MFNYQSYKIGSDLQNLFIFLHGYNSTINDYQYAIDWFKDKLDSTLLIIPESPEICDKNPQKKQWFGMIKNDPNNKRTQKNTSTEEIIQIYDKTGADIAKQSKLMNDFIQKLQKEHNFTDRQTYLCGFSQGAMMTLYTAITHKQPLAGAFVIAGLLAGINSLENKKLTHTPITLLHGEDDSKVQYKTMNYTKNWLQKHNIPVLSYTYPQLSHHISEPEIDRIISLI